MAEKKTNAKINNILLKMLLNFKLNFFLQYQETNLIENVYSTYLKYGIEWRKTEHYNLKMIKSDLPEKKLKH